MKRTVRARGFVAYWGTFLAALVILIAGGIAYSSLAHSLQVQREAERHYDAAVAFQASGDWGKSADEYEQVLRIQADYRHVPQRLATARQCEAATATARAQEPVMTTTAQAQALAMAAETASAMEAQRKTATATAERAMALDLQSRSALAYESAGSLDKAKEELEKVLQQDPGYGDAAAQLAAVNKALAGRAATATADALVQLDVVYRRGLVLAKMEKWAEAKAAFDQVFAAVPDYKDIQAALTESEAKVSAQATTDAQAVVQAHYERGVTYEQMKKWQQAVAEFEAVSAMDPRYQDVQARLVEAQAAWQADKALAPTVTATPAIEPTTTPMPSPMATPTLTVEKEVHMSWTAVPPDWGRNFAAGARVVQKSAFFEMLDGEYLDRVHRHGGDGTAQSLLDGDPNTVWATQSDKFPHAIEVDLGNDVEVNRIGFVNCVLGHLGPEGSDYARDIEVSIKSSDSDEEFRKLAEFQLLGLPGNPPEQYTLLQPYSFSPIKVRIVRISIKSNYFKGPRHPGGVCLAEIAIFGRSS